MTMPHYITGDYVRPPVKKEQKLSIAFCNVGIMESALQGSNRNTHYRNIRSQVQQLLQKHGVLGICFCEMGQPRVGLSQGSRARIEATIQSAWRDAGAAEHGAAQVFWAAPDEALLAVFRHGRPVWNAGAAEHGVLPQTTWVNVLSHKLEKGLDPLEPRHCAQVLDLSIGGGGSAAEHAGSHVADTWAEEASDTDPDLASMEPDKVAFHQPEKRRTQYDRPKYLRHASRLPTHLQEASRKIAAKHGIVNLSLWQSFLFFVALIMKEQSRPLMQKGCSEHLAEVLGEKHELLVFHRNLVAIRLDTAWRTRAKQGGTFTENSSLARPCPSSSSWHGASCCAFSDTRAACISCEACCLT